MNINFLFIFFSIPLIIWFVIYVYKLFLIYQIQEDLAFQDNLALIKDPLIFEKVKNGNNVSRVIINGVVDISSLQNKVDQQQKLVDDISKKIREQDFENSLEDIKRRALVLEKENASLNTQLTALRREFEDIINNISSFTILTNGRSNNPRSLNKDLLHYLYKDIVNPHEIITK